jgi:hypothetical protein
MELDRKLYLSSLASLTNCFNNEYGQFNDALEILTQGSLIKPDLVYSSGYVHQIK